jgi:drug/metabolite transporter (DMT)-like permease
MSNDGRSRSTSLEPEALADLNVAPHSSSSAGQHWIADLCLLATTLIWGVNILAFKYSIGIFDPVVFNASRLVFSWLALLACVWLESRWRKAPLWPRSRAEHPIRWGSVVLFSALTGGLYLILYLNGIMRTTAGNTALLLSSMPMWTAVFSFFLLRERLPPVTWLGLALTLAGTLTVTLAGGKVSLASEHFTGNLLMLGAALTWAVGTVISRPILLSMTPLQLTFIASLLTTPLHLLWIAPQLGQLQFAGWTAGSALPTASDIAAGEARLTVTPWLMLAIVYSGALSTGLAYALWNTGVKILGGSHAAVYQNVVTLVAVAGGWLFLREQILAAQVVGGAVIIAGLLLMRRGRK